MAGMIGGRPDAPVLKRRSAREGEERVSNSTNRCVRAQCDFGHKLIA